MKPKDKLQLIKPAVANLPALTPPPRKEDILNAMVERARVKHQEEIDRLSAKRKETEEKFNAAVLEELRKNPQNFTTYVRNYSKPEVEFTMEVIPPAIAKLKGAIRQVPTIRHFDPVAAKKHIRESLGASATDRVKTLLSNPEAVKAMDAALEKM